MNDIEMLKRCAEKMGYLEVLNYTETIYARDKDGVCQFAPLHDDAQAMALVKKFGLGIYKDGDEWGCYQFHPDGPDPDVTNPDLNRAIVECVSKLP